MPLSHEKTPTPTSKRTTKTIEEILKQEYISKVEKIRESIVTKLLLEPSILEATNN